MNETMQTGPGRYTEHLGESYYQFVARKVAKMLKYTNEIIGNTAVVPLTEQDIEQVMQRRTGVCLIVSIDGEPQVSHFHRIEQPIELFNLQLLDKRSYITVRPHEIASVANHPDNQYKNIAAPCIKEHVEKIKLSDKKAFFTAVLTDEKTVLPMFQRVDERFKRVQWSHYPWIAFFDNTINEINGDITRTVPQLSQGVHRLSKLYGKHKQDIDQIHGYPQLERFLIINDTNLAVCFENEMNLSFEHIMGFPFPLSEENLTFEQYQLQVLFCKMIWEIQQTQHYKP